MIHSSVTKIRLQRDFSTSAKKGKANTKRLKIIFIELFRSKKYFKD